MLHTLELTNQRTELLTVIPDIASGVVESTKSETGHLSSNTNSTLVEDADGVLVTLATLAEKVLLGDLDIVEVDNACA